MTYREAYKFVEHVRHAGGPGAIGVNTPNHFKLWAVIEALTLKILEQEEELDMAHYEKFEGDCGGRL